VRVLGSTRRRRHRRQGLGGSRARSAWACSCGSSACARSSGARLEIYASTAAPAAKVLAALERSALNAGLFSREQCLYAFAAARVWGATRRRRHRKPMSWRLPSALGAGLFSREQYLRTQQRRAFGELYVGGTGCRGLGCSRARSARACSHGSNACARNSGALLQRRSFGELRVGGSTKRRRRLRFWRGPLGTVPAQVGYRLI
jgi:hypothetical protein